MESLSTAPTEAVADGPLEPTWNGRVSTAGEALMLFEACLDGTLHHCPRRPHDRERRQLIQSGNVFIYEENASGIKRWTDGVPWSPSRILGNFLVYRELIKPFPPGEKKRATKNSRRTKAGEPYPRSNSTEDPISPTTPINSENGLDRGAERALIGSLVDSYGFKEGGLIKKTMSVSISGIQHHLVSYYRLEEASKSVLRTPPEDPRLANIRPRAELTKGQNFRAPLDDLEHENLSENMDAVSPSGYVYSHTIYGPRTDVTAGEPSDHSHRQSAPNIFATLPSPNPSLQSSGLPFPLNGPQLPSNAPQLQPLGTQLQTEGHIYGPPAIVNSQRGYLPTPNQSVSSLGTQESYDAYNNHGYQSTHNAPPTLQTDRRGSQPQHTYSYPARQGSLASLSNGTLESTSHTPDERSIDSVSWDRRPSNTGAHARIPAHSPQSNLYHGQWNMISPPAHGPQRSELPWVGHDSSHRPELPWVGNEGSSWTGTHDGYQPASQGTS